MRRTSGQNGMTMVEMVISIVLISIAMTAVLTAFSTSMGRSSDPLWRNKALQLSQAYLDEILSKKYDESTPLGGLPASTSINCGSLGSEEGTNRSIYDDVDDYDGIDEIPSLVIGGSLASYTLYNVQVSVVCAGGEVGRSNDEVKRVTVTVTPPNQSPMPFSVYRSNF